MQTDCSITLLNFFEFSLQIERPTRKFEGAAFHGSFIISFKLWLKLIFWWKLSSTIMHAIFISFFVHSLLNLLPANKFMNILFNLISTKDLILGESRFMSLRLIEIRFNWKVFIKNANYKKSHSLKQKSHSLVKWFKINVWNGFVYDVLVDCSIENISEI